MNHRELLDLFEHCGHFLYHRRGGKRGQGRILSFLSEEGSISQGDLQKRLHIEAGSMSEVVTKLEQQGLITRIKDTEDRRKTILEITEMGKVESVKNRIILREQEDRLFETLTEEEKVQLGFLLEKLYGDWKLSFDKSLFEHRKHCKKNTN